MNFNDFFGSMMVLIAFVISNNWNALVDIYCESKGSSIWPKLFFTSYFFLVGLIMLNIIISFVMEVYDALDDVVIRELNKENNLVKLSEAMPEGQGLRRYVKHVLKEAEKEQMIEQLAERTIIVSTHAITTMHMSN